MNDSTPAMNAASSVTFSISSTGFSLITPGGPPSPGLDAGAGGSELGSSVPFTGGRSWKRKSHFQRSDGFDICSQVRIDTGRLNIICCSAPYACRWMSSAAISVRARSGVDSRETEEHREIREDEAIVLRVAGRRDDGRGALHLALVVGVRRVLLERRRSRQHEISGGRQL